MSNEEKLNTLRIIELEKRVDLQVMAAEKAVILATSELKSRLDTMNEFRASLRDQANTFISRNEFESKIEGLEKNRRDNFALWISLLSLLVAFINIIMRGLVK